VAAERECRRPRGIERPRILAGDPRGPAGLAASRIQGQPRAGRFTYAVYGLIYGVLLAFTIVVAWQRFAETEQLVMHEATLLSELWRDSVVARPFMRDDIEKNLIAYAQSVIDDEWPAMAAHGRAHPQTERLYERLWGLTYHFEPSTKIQEAYMAEFLGRMNELSAARRLRVLHSRMEIHGVLWMVLVIGAVPTVAYPCSSPASTPGSRSRSRGASC